LIGLAFALVGLAACGGDDAPDNPECTLVGTSCTTSDECCTGNCDPGLSVCTREPGVCREGGEGCEAAADCCSFACVDFECSSDQCTSDGESCDGDGECCGGSCVDGACAPLNPECHTSGNACTTHGECCSGYCGADGVCSASPSFCIQTGDACTGSEECCGGICTIAEGASMGLCALVPASGATQCQPAGEVCDVGADYEGGPLPTCGGECCSRACFPFGPEGILVCQPPSGCKPTGELCREDSDCCGGPGQPDNDPSDVHCSKEPGNDVGRCDNGNSCAPAGAICRLQDIQCNATDNCCAGNVQNFDTCRQDSLGIPRCGQNQAPPECTDPTVYEGMSCATSADCCGLPCVPVPGSEFDLVCGAACQQTGSTCTTSADCCSTLPCVIAPGEPYGTCGEVGTCAEYGQECATSDDCCGGVPCNGGLCIQIVN
jgi:hypothetical protein